MRHRGGGPDDLPELAEDQESDAEPAMQKTKRMKKTYEQRWICPWMVAPAILNDPECANWVSKLADNPTEVSSDAGFDFRERAEKKQPALYEKAEAHLLVPGDVDEDEVKKMWEIWKLSLNHYDDILGLAMPREGRDDIATGLRKVDLEALRERIGR